MGIREMSERQFIAAAKRNGFEVSPTGTHLIDPSLGFGSGLVLIIGKRGGLRKICFRQSLARAIQERAKLRREREARAAQPNPNTLCDDCSEPRSVHSPEPPHKSSSPKCKGFYHFVSSELIGDAQIARGLCADVSLPDESDVCPHGVGYDDECEKCDDEDECQYDHNKLALYGDPCPKCGIVEGSDMK